MNRDLPEGTILESDQRHPSGVEQFTQDSPGMDEPPERPATEAPDLDDLYNAGLHRLQTILQGTDAQAAMSAFSTIHQIRQEQFWLHKQEEGEIRNATSPQPPIPVYLVPNPDGTDSSEQEAAPVKAATRKRSAAKPEET